MIISFYPGAGGSRYLQLLLGKDWTRHGVSYDNTNQQQVDHRYLLRSTTIKKDGHILTHCINSKLIQSTFPNQEIIFIKSGLKESLRREWALHGHNRYISTVNHDTISKLEHYNAVKDPSWPEISTVSMLDSLPKNILDEVNKNYQTIVKKQINPQTKLEYLTQDCVTKIHSAYENISWHQNYYNQYPEDFSLAHQIIDIDNDQTDFTIFMRKELKLYPSEFYDKVWATIYE
jgi:hypothetical protein